MKKDNKIFEFINKEDGEIDLNKILSPLNKKRNIIYKSILFFFICGLFISFISEKQYFASSTFIFKSSNNPSATLSGIEALTGISLGNINSSENIFTPETYNLILSSVPFKKELIEEKILFNDKIQPYKEIFNKKENLSLRSILRNYTIGLPSVIKNIYGKLILFLKGMDDKSVINPEQILTNTKIYKLSKSEKKLLSNIDKNLSFDINDNNTLTLSALTNDPYLSANLVFSSLKLLEKYVVDFEIRKSRESLQFIEDQYDDKKKDFYEKQSKLAKFKDSNKLLSTSKSKNELDKLEAEYQLSFSIFNQISKELEAKKIEVQKEIPIFTILEPTIVPLSHKYPNRISILLLTIFYGITFSIIIIYLSTFYESNFKI